MLLLLLTVWVTNMASVIRGSGTSEIGGDLEVEGKIVTSGRPYFRARLGADFSITPLNSEVTLPINTITVNDGSHFSVSDYKFTAPVDGLYFFRSSMRLDSLQEEAQYYRFGISTDTTGPEAASVTKIYDYDGFDKTSIYWAASITRVMKLNAGDKVWATVRQAGGTAGHAHVDDGNDYTEFLGYLIG